MNNIKLPKTHLRGEEDRDYNVENYDVKFPKGWTDVEDRAFFNDFFKSKRRQNLNAELACGGGAYDDQTTYPLAITSKLARAMRKVGYTLKLWKPSIRKLLAG